MTKITVNMYGGAEAEAEIIRTENGRQMIRFVNQTETVLVRERHSNVWQSSGIICENEMHLPLSDFELDNFDEDKNENN